ncbi:diadenosine tetraphosphatase [Marivita lacus]|uniref:Diadenosine tetraphosphatase n=1 Tax=Marivita lacus TaxID=1323742 RepID=A0ABQ1L9M5_9RHOB|nr:metallophosphoesterase [Marivita lacus]GGC21595.1 diadenosine tetraphosphatase [Marivita lacus]
MSITDIIPDIHGQAEKLRLALKNLGWRRNGTTWVHPEPDRQIVLLGDFIDRGPENGAVIRIVRELMDAGRAQAIMGNHELNAIHFHTDDPDNGAPLRVHDKGNLDQHESFLKEFPLGAPQTKDVLNWMKGLPLFIETDEFRAVHAAWIQSAIDDLRRQTGVGVLSEDQLIRAGRKGDAFYDLVEAVAKGPEARLPYPHFFEDKGGKVRHHVRLKWWNSDARTWRQVAMSVPDINQLPDTPLSDDLSTAIYPDGDTPVFFGHYWMSGNPELQSANALCLDYSAGADGPLVTYSHFAGSCYLSLENVAIHR